MWGCQLAACRSSPQLCPASLEPRELVPAFPACISHSNHGATEGAGGNKACARCRHSVQRLRGRAEGSVTLLCQAHRPSREGFGSGCPCCGVCVLAAPLPSLPSWLGLLAHMGQEDGPAGPPACCGCLMLPAPGLCCLRGASPPEPPAPKRMLPRAGSTHRLLPRWVRIRGGGARAGNTR